MEEGDWGENFMSSFWTWPGRWNTRLCFVFDFANLGGKVEDKDGEVEDANTGDDQVHLENYYQVTWMKMPVISVMSVMFTV